MNHSRVVQAHKWFSSTKTNKPVEKEMDRYGAEVPHSMSVEDPQHWGEVKQLEQGQTMKQQHHQATFPPIWQGPPVLPTPTQPPQQVHQAWGGDKKNKHLKYIPAQ